MTQVVEPDSAIDKVQLFCPAQLLDSVLELRCRSSVTSNFREHYLQWRSAAQVLCAANTRLVLSQALVDVGGDPRI